MNVFMNATETAIYREQETALAQINDLARANASARHTLALAAIEAAYQAEKDAIDAAYAAGARSVISQIVSNR